MSIELRLLFFSTSRSTLRRLALLADRAACFEFLNMIGRERNLARPDQVDGDLANAVGRIDRELVERFDVTGNGDDKPFITNLTRLGCWWIDFATRCRSDLISARSSS